MEATSLNTIIPTPINKLAGFFFDTFLIILILTGVLFRSSWVNWSQGTNLHPDEYGLTNTLTRLAIPENFEDYFNTRISSLSPYQKYDQAGNPTESGPDNRMRWGQLPITIIRFAGELSGNTGYDEIRLLGRKLSAAADGLSLLLIFLIGLKLYGYRVSLMATALSSLAVMQIQQSHFMTVDNFGSLFSTLALYACVQIASQPSLKRSLTLADQAHYTLTSPAWAWYLVFGAAFGMAMACKINLLPVGGLVLVAAFISIADLKLKNQVDLKRIFALTAALLALAFISAIIFFRLAQPMSFRAANGNTTIFSLQPNRDWVDSMKVASAESSGQGGGPPSEQWAHRMAILFPLTNMILWGMGIPLGLAAWSSFGAAIWQTLRSGKNWQAHLLPLVWIGGYFFFMGTRWVKSVRYFLPIYPFLCLMAAWGLYELWKWAKEEKYSKKRPARLFFSATLIAFTLLGTLGWSNAFVEAIYRTPHTRIQAATWIYQNIPGPFHLSLKMADGTLINEPIGAPDNLRISALNPYSHSFRLPFSGVLSQIIIPRAQSSNPGTLRLVIANDPAGENILGETRLTVTTVVHEQKAMFPNIPLEQENIYYLLVSNESQYPIQISRTVIANENWDEGLPMPYEGRNPFGDLYSGRTMEIRWADDEHKRETMLNTLAESDYLILPSQRAVWSTCRIPKTYPMTMEYYRALFDGRLGFEQVAAFSAPIILGPVQISDVGGTIAWNKTPSLPLFNSSWLAAEEAFSVYDHPPVWIFKKRADFNPENAAAILHSVDLTKVVVQSATNADGNWCPAE